MPMDPDRLKAFEDLAAEASLNPGRTIAHAVAGRMQVSIFIDGKHHETIINDAGKRLRATMLAFDGKDLQEVLADRSEVAAREAKLLELLGDHFPETLEWLAKYCPELYPDGFGDPEVEDEV